MSVQDKANVFAKYRRHLDLFVSRFEPLLRRKKKQTVEKLGDIAEKIRSKTRNIILLVNHLPQTTGIKSATSVQENSKNVI
jgi:hypothetical protein